MRGMQKADTNLERLTLLRVDDALLPELHPLLEYGVGLRLQKGVGLKDFLRHEVGLQEDLLRADALGVRVDGELISDFETCVLHAGAVVEILDAASWESSARGNVEQGEAVSPSAPQHSTPAGDSVVWLRILGDQLELQASGLLRRGVLLGMARMDALLRGLPERFWQQSGGILLRGTRINPLTHELGMPQTDALVELEVRERQEGENS